MSSQPIVVTTTKNVGIAIILTVFFGPLGMLYATIPGGIFMGLIGLAAILLAFVTHGFSLLLFCLIWPLSMMWAALAAHSFNQKALKRAPSNRV
ncbi:MAG: hypothetical protein KDD73_11115 [Anaerolineales bacterium]|nr:hypothetical protein [Anaerolineales bacterium]MCB9126926.1 hypothetical protein [Ardenticatenales bacterium]MCB9171470.1 hypothetical protein [Ardenticatenales bacterium]